MNNFLDLFCLIQVLKFEAKFTSLDQNLKTKSDKNDNHKTVKSHKRQINQSYIYLHDSEKYASV